MASETVPKHEPETEVAPDANWFWGTLRRFRRIYAQAVLATVFVNLLAVALPLFAMMIYDRVVPARNEDTLWLLVIGIGAVFAFEFLLRALRALFVDTAARSAETAMASAVFRRAIGIRLDARPASTGAFARNIAELEALRGGFSATLLVALVDVPFALLFICIVAIIGGPLALVPAAAVLLILGIAWMFQKRRRSDTGIGGISAEKHSLLVESLADPETIKALGAEGRMQRAWDRLSGIAAKNAQQSQSQWRLCGTLSALADQIAVVAVIAAGVYLIFAGQITVGALVACTILSERAVAPLVRVADLWGRFDRSLAAFKAIDAIMKLPAERPAGAHFAEAPGPRGAIEFDCVRFQYPGRHMAALDGVSLSIKPGERVAIIGKIGAGKSTVAKLILGLYQPQEGAVRVGGLDIRLMDPAELRRGIAYVPQDVTLFTGSVRDNIAMGMPEAGDDVIRRATDIAGLDAMVARQPLGFDLDVGERGERLSGGQRQTVAIARALVRDADILILDEPTAAMDKVSEDGFVKRLRETLDGKTLIVATQRLTLLALAERLIVMDNGKAVADGPRDEVLAQLVQGQIRAAG